MNVFRSYTRKSLAKNRTRTLVTILGIVLSMALLTAVVEGAWSGLQFLIRGEIEKSGAYHGAILDLDADELAQLQDETEIDTMNVWQQVGWAEIENSQYSSPYLLIEGMQEETTLLPLDVLDGRLPEQKNELAIPDMLNAYRETPLSVGDTLTLTVGTRTVDGQIPAQNEPFSAGETLERTTEQTFTVVGIYHRLPYEFETYVAPYYTALTCGSGTGSYSAFFTVKHPAGAYSFFETVNRLGSGVRDHQYLLAYYGGVRGRGLREVLYGFAAILVVLIAFGSVSLIYNSFSISVSERTRQFGILKSVGATRKQIRGAVLYEALCLCAIAIPLGLVIGCVGIGLTLYLLREGFRVLVGADSAVEMELVLNLPALGIAAAVCLLTTLLSAWVPAIRAVRVTPMQAIRQSEDVKLTQRDVRSAKLTQRLFGFAGTMASKNFRRNRKRYRATVISLFLSVVLFIAASSFCAYLTDAVNTSLGENTPDYELLYYAGEQMRADEADARLRLLQTGEHVTDGTYLITWGGSLCYDPADVTDACLGSQTVYMENGSLRQETLLLFLQDDAFRALCAENGLDAEAYFDAEHPLALVKNEAITRYYNEGGVHWETYEVLKSGSLPAEIRFEQVRYELEGGWQYYSPGSDGNSYVYYPAAYLDEYWNVNQGQGEPDQSKAKILTKEEACTTAQFTAGAILGKLSYALTGSNQPALIYPYSLYPVVMPAELGDYTPNFVFTTDDHAAAFTAMSETMENLGLKPEALYDMAEQAQSERMLVNIVDVFSYGFIVVISLIAAANVFNTVSTSINLRRRELAMLESIGLGKRDFYRMMNYECGIYGCKALLFGLPAAFLLTCAIFRVTGAAYNRSFYIPWYSILIAVGSVFLVVFASMLYAARKLRRENVIDALKLETL